MPYSKFRRWSRNREVDAVRSIVFELLTSAPCLLLLFLLFHLLLRKIPSGMTSGSVEQVLSECERVWAELKRRLSRC